jgi:hypothetical protein
VRISIPGGSWLAAAAGPGTRQAAAKDIASPPMIESFLEFMVFCCVQFFS